MKHRILTTIILLLVVLSSTTVLALGFGKRSGDPMTGEDGPDLVLKVMEQAVVVRDFQQFRDVLSDSFTYEADLGTISMYPGIDWDHWDISKEEGFLKKFLSPAVESALNLTDKVTERGMPYDQEARYELTYQMTVEGQTFIGGALFVFEEINLRWYLRSWKEIMPITNEATGGFYTNSGEVRASLIP